MSSLNGNAAPNTDLRYEVFFSGSAAPLTGRATMRPLSLRTLPDSLAAGVCFTRAVECQGNGILFSEVALASAISFFDFELVADSAQCL